MDAHHLIEVKKNRKIPEFRAGDTVQVNYRVTEGERTRIQPFQGVVIRRMGGKGPAAGFTVRRVTRGFGVERTFPLHSPHIESVEIQRYGKVRRAKLYYLRERSGRAARIKEQTALPEWRKAGAVLAPLEEELEPEEELEAEAVDEAATETTDEVVVAAAAAEDSEATEETAVDAVETPEVEAPAAEVVAEEPEAPVAEVVDAEQVVDEAPAEEAVVEAATEEPEAPVAETVDAEPVVDEAPAEEAVTEAAEEPEAPAEEPSAPEEPEAPKAQPG